MRTTDRLYAELQRMAITYEWKPGERINELELSKRLNVSRSPLREALNRLASEGFLIIKPNLGFFCRSFDPNELYDLYDFRCALEMQIVKLAAERGADPVLHAIVEMAQADSSDEKADVLLRQDEAFHLALAEATGNNEFVKALIAVNNRIHFARWIDLRTRERSKEEHISIAQAVEDRDGDLAASLIQKHIQRRYKQIVEITKIGFGEMYVRKA